MRIRIYPYKLGSESARKLKDGLIRMGHNVLCVKPDGRYRYRDGDLIINWGNSLVPEWMSNNAVNNTLNKPHNVANATNKINTLQTLFSSEIPTVPFTTDKEVAKEWGAKVYVRTILNGHSGVGIQIIDCGINQEEKSRIDAISSELDDLGFHYLAEQLQEEYDGGIVAPELPDAPLYTKAIRNTGEYRVHVFKGEIIDYRKKSRHREDEPTEAQGAIRTLANGWIYRSQNLERLERVENLALSAIDALGLDFGAVDIIKDENGDVFVLEVNTACGMEDNTLAKYLEAINNMVNV